MKEAVFKAITDVFIELKLSDIIDSWTGGYPR
jgi:hypothetical protein